MRRTVQLTIILKVLSFLSLAFLVVLSVACDPGNPSGVTNQNAAAVNTQANTQSTASTPNSNSPANKIGDTPDTGPTIRITEVPGKGAGPDALETIAGTVSGVKATDCKVVIFARTNTWYVQPYIDSSDTAINENSTWRSDTHLGSQYAALLVKTSYKPPTTTGKLPAIGGPVLAVATADAKQ
jgi:hypothetical protein